MSIMRLIKFAKKREENRLNMTNIKAESTKKSK